MLQQIHAPMGENSHQTHQSKLKVMRKVQDLMLRPAIEAVPGVAEVATLGGETSEVVVQTSAPSRARLRRPHRPVFSHSNGLSRSPGRTTAP